MASPSDEIYWDSNVVIDCLSKAEPWFHHIEPILRSAERRKVSIVVSVVCKAEVLTVRGNVDDRGLQTIADFFEQPYVHLYAVSERTADIAADVRRRSSLDTADAIHLATAIERKVTTLLTRDGEGARNKGNRDTLLELNKEFGDPSIDIMTPQTYFGNLPDEVKQQVIPHEQEEDEEKDEEAD